MIRLLHMVTTLDIGGAEAQILEVLSRLPRPRFEVVIAWLKGRGEMVPQFEAAGIRTVRLNMHGLLDTAVYRKAFRLVRREKPHLVHTHLMKADLIGGAAAKMSAVPVLVSTKHNEDRYLRRLALAAAARGVAELADRVVHISDAVGEFLQRRLLLPEAKLHRIRYGYPTPNGGEPSGEKARADLRSELGVPASARLVAVVGRLAAQKGLMDLLRAAGLLLEALPEARFLLVGRGEQRASLLKLAKDLDLTEAVKFLGFRRDIPRILAGSDLLVLPSHWEGFGMVLLEAMNAGLPVVGTRVGAIPEVIADGTTGILVPPRDPETLATAIVRILRNPDLAAGMGNAGRRRLRDEFAIERAVDAHVALYEELLRLRSTE